MTHPLARAALSALQPTYLFTVAAKNFAYQHNLLRAKFLHWPVISVGNLSSGGAGKTPIVIELARLLTAQGYSVDVLSRGYGRRSPVPIEQVELGGSAQRFGDEPLLIAESTGVPVYVGASRFAVGLLAEQNLPPHARSQRHLHLLDDGFQHRQLRRSVDLVVLHPRDLTDRLLPLGRLREPLTALRRASVFLVRDDDNDSPVKLAAMGLAQPVWRIHRSLAVPESSPHSTASAGSQIERPAFAFCGIAHPSDFFSALSQHNVSPVGTLAFPDHHVFTGQDCFRIAEAARSVSARSLLTTQKDFVRLSAAHKSQLSQSAALVPIPLRVAFLDEANCMAQLLRLISV